MKSSKSRDDKVLARFYGKTSNGNSLKLRIMALPDERYEEFIDLFMKYFVAQEETHRVTDKVLSDPRKYNKQCSEEEVCAFTLKKIFLINSTKSKSEVTARLILKIKYYDITGILESPEAMNEFRKHLSKYFKNEFIQILICCLDSDETASEIFGGSVLKLHRKGYRYDDDVEAQTEPVKKCKKVDKILECLISAVDIMTRYDIDRFYEHIYAVVRSDMRQMGILTELTKASDIMCQMHGVVLIGTWCTSVGSVKVAKNRGSTAVCEINYKDLGQLSDLTFEDDSHTIKFMVQRYLKSSKI